MTRFVTQTTFHSPDREGGGNCAEAACASIFGLPLSSVPRFYDPEGKPTTSYRYWRNFENFCGSQGYYVIRRDAELHIEAIHLASGPSERGCSHMVVMQNGKLLHDPHPSGKGLVKVEQTWLLVPKDPLAFTRNA